MIDLIGNVHDQTGTRSLATLRPGGLIVNAPTGSWPTFSDDAKAAGVHGSHYKVGFDGSTLAVIARLLETDRVRVNIDTVFDLADVAGAHHAIESGHTRGKIVLAVSDA